MVFLIIGMSLFHAKDSDCVKGLIKLNRWQTKASVTDVKTSSFGYHKCAMIYGCFSSTEKQIPKENKKAEILDHFMMN